jgi:hypothetical protein
MPKIVVFTAHALQRMRERGATQEDVRKAISIGNREPAQRGLFQYRLNLEYNNVWDGRFYRLKQVMPIVADEPEKLTVITVYAFYFQEGEER